ncbi:MAG TPA: YiiG family protein [Pyrinomonadaceae bacterium]|nr:YiiG family protein [Pyrinomonadaceae bacterium]
MRNSSKRHFSSIVLVILALAVTLGCARISEMIKKESGNAPASSPSSPSTDGPGKSTRGEGENTLVKKTNYYISDCYNRYSNRIVESHNRYASWIKDVEQGPTGKERIVYGLYDVTGDGSDCEKALESAKGLEPSMPELDAASDAYLVALKQAIAAIRDIYPYYEQEDYKDDGFAKGKAAHSGLMEAFRDFKTANTAFASQVDRLEDEVAEKEFERLTDDGRTSEAVVVETGIKAKKIKNLLQQKEFEKITADELNPLIEEFGETVERLKTENSKPSANLYTSACDEFTKASKEMMRRIRDGKKFTDIERRQIAMGAGWMVEGSPAKVIKAYNDMIQRRSMARF